MNTATHWQFPTDLKNVPGTSNNSNKNIQHLEPVLYQQIHTRQNIQHTPILERHAEQEPALIPQGPIIALNRSQGAQATTTPAATLPPLEPGCGRIGLAVGSYSNIPWIEPPPTGEGVSILTLTVCNGTNGTTTGSLQENYVIPASQTGENAEYCDNYDESLIICISSAAEGDGTAAVLDISAGPTSDGSNTETVALPGVRQPVHVAVLSSGIVATANYDGNSFGTFDPGLEGGAVIQTVTVPEGNASADAGDPGRQEAPHPHQILEIEDGTLLICDLGTDSVYRYRVSPDGALTAAGFTKVAAGSGPRHAAKGPNGKVYVVAELTVQLLELGSNCTEGSQGGAAGVCNTVDLPKSAGASNFTSGAAVRVSEDNKYVYVSLRAEEDSTSPGAIVGYEIGADGAIGELVGTWVTGGPKPRDFNLVKVPGIAGELIVVGNRKADAVEVFERNVATGVMGEMIASLPVASPTSILALTAEVGAVAGAATATNASEPATPAAPAPTANGTASATAAAPAGGACGGGGQPVCSGAQLESTTPRPCFLNTLPVLIQCPNVHCVLLFDALLVRWRSEPCALVLQLLQVHFWKWEELCSLFHLSFVPGL